MSQRFSETKSLLIAAMNLATWASPDDVIVEPSIFIQWSDYLDQYNLNVETKSMQENWYLSTSSTFLEQ